MPFVHLMTNVSVEDKNALQTAIGETITLIPNKTAARTMILIEDEQDLYFACTNDPCAMIEVQVNEGTDQSDIKTYCLAMIEMVAKTIGVPETRIFINVNEVDSWVAKK